MDLDQLLIALSTRGPGPGLNLVLPVVPSPVINQGRHITKFSEIDLPRIELNETSMVQGNKLSLDISTHHFGTSPGSLLAVGQVLDLYRWPCGRHAWCHQYCAQH